MRQQRRRAKEARKEGTRARRRNASKKKSRWGKIWTWALIFFTFSFTSLSFSRSLSPLSPSSLHIHFLCVSYKEKEYWPRKRFHWRENHRVINWKQFLPCFALEQGMRRYWDCGQECSSAECFPLLLSWRNFIMSDSPSKSRWVREIFAKSQAGVTVMMGNYKSLALCVCASRGILRILCEHL
jgi:hypothetical protein